MTRQERAKEVYVALAAKRCGIDFHTVDREECDNFFLDYTVLDIRVIDFLCPWCFLRHVSRPEFCDDGKYSHDLIKAIRAQQDLLSNDEPRI
jgi:hypothetical protein